MTDSAEMRAGGPEGAPEGFDGEAALAMLDEMVRGTVARLRGSEAQARRKA